MLEGGASAPLGGAAARPSAADTLGNSLQMRLWNTAALHPAEEAGRARDNVGFLSPRQGLQPGRGGHAPVRACSSPPRRRRCCRHPPSPGPSPGRLPAGAWRLRLPSVTGPCASPKAATKAPEPGPRDADAASTPQERKGYRQAPDKTLVLRLQPRQNKTPRGQSPSPAPQLSGLPGARVEG